MNSETNIPKQIIGSAPFFLVADVAKAAEYYRDVLGFSYDQLWGDPPEFCMCRRDGFVVMLCQCSKELQNAPNGRITGHAETWDAYFWVRDAEALYQEMHEKGTSIVYEPVLREHYDMKEFAVQDLDGYVLAFGQDLPKNT